MRDNCFDFGGYEPFDLELTRPREKKKIVATMVLNRKSGAGLIGFRTGNRGGDEEIGFSSK